MKYLKNFQSAHEYFDIERRQFFRSSITQSIIGWYNLIESSLSGIYVLDKKIYIIWLEDQFLVENNCELKVARTSIRAKRLASLYCNSNLLLEFNYFVEESFSNISPFEYLDDEDSDWGLFLSHIINKRERRYLFIDAMSKFN